MAITLGDAVLYLAANDSKLNSTLKDVESKTMSWIGGLGGKIAMGLGAVVTAAIGGAVALGTAAFAAGNKLDAAYDTLLIKTGASGDALAQLQADFKSVFSSIPTEAEPAANALALIYQRLGSTGEQSQTLTKQILEMSRMMGTDATASAETFTRMMGDAGLSAEEGSLMLDKIFVSSQKSGIGLDRLMGLATQFGSPMRLMGFTIDDTISLLSKWEKEGVNTELVMGSLRIAAGKFADEGKPLRESLLETFESIKNNKDATAALSKGMDVFGAKAGPDMVAAIREGRFEIDDMVAALQGADGAILKTAKKTMDWGEKLTMLKNKATLALEPIGMKLMDVASAVLDKAGPALDWFSGIIDKFVVPALDKAVNAFGYLFDLLAIGDSLFTVFEDGSTVLEGFFTRLGMGSTDAEALAGKIIEIASAMEQWITGTLIPFVQEHWPQIQGVLLGIGAALAAAGIVSIVTSIGAAIAAVGAPVLLLIGLAALLGAAWTSNWGGIQEKTQAAIEFVKGILDGGMQFINDLVNGKLGLLSLIFTAAWANIQLIFAAFQAGLSGDWHRFGELLRTAWDNSWRVIGAVLQTAWINIQNGVRTGIQNVKDFFTKMDWGQVGRNILQGIANGITGGLKIIADAAKAAATTALEAAQGFLGISSPSKVFAEEVGKPSAEGFGKGFADQMGKMGPDAGGAALNSFGSVPTFSGGGGGGPVQFTYVDQRFISLTDEFDAERILAPIIERFLNNRGYMKATA
jgi:phage-related minor tail protein